ncbi:MAG: Cellulase/cellobiase CelA1 [Chloroflexi bacterium AL-W]|nr:Cellulase/cellobiase CelA1 [Chloroflexi bacterium AL-N1]NOK65891.1 Cellulase/cellobiase CelA1 [Chloroflexi bacterium AL-N10]NOK72772.1 Cellulase/cellobiase CelA1 [Chloroflexi bacterium AL-N5]NOK79669.1 Cellulase/cellobiase CelA1 [Chloroflexi bacterium AL-W]NOK92994.1 Cellulase/cellobiase CelA1 [Chloroflexi bacterium AL-N15]
MKRWSISTLIITIMLLTVIGGILQPRVHAASNVTIYNDALASGWSNWSWGTLADFKHTGTVHGGSTSIAVTYNNGWSGLSLATSSPISTSGYQSLTFWAHGGASGTRALQIFTQSSNSGGDSAVVPVAVPSGQWQQVSVSISALGNPATIARVNIQDRSGNAQPTFYLDDMRLRASGSSNPTPHPTDPPTPTSPPSSGNYNYGEALQKSILFFEANRSGRLPADQRFEWRGNSALNDGSDVRRDLTGGYYDAGDHVKFGQPMATSIAMMSWSVVEYRDAYQQAGQLDEALEAIKWGTDYFLKAHITDGNGTKEFYVQVGNGDADHAYWGPPEEMTMSRPAYKITRDKPGSDVAADTAAALAASSIAFRSSDPAYADTLVNNARQLYAFADQYRAKYSDSVPEACPFYCSWGGYNDELVWGSIWLYKATGDSSYLTKAENYYLNWFGGLGDWSVAADEKSYGAALLLAQESSNTRFKNDVESWLNTWINGTGAVQYSPGGLAWRTEWGSLVLSSATAFLAGVYNDTVRADSRYVDFATSQVDYILGDNPRNSSYMVGFGNNYPLRVHHRAAHGGSDMGSSEPNNNILYGALVAGPKSTDDFDYSDSRTDWVSNEVGTGYNAPLMGALVFMYDRYGGQPLSDAELSALPGVR